MTRVTPATRVRAAIVAARSPASAGVVCIFQLAATMTSRISANHARAGSAASARARRRASPGARAVRARAGPPSGGSRVARRARRASPPASRAGPPRPAGRRTAAALQAPVGLERRDRIELAAGGADRALEVRRLGVEDPVELAAQGPRDLPRLELEQGARCPDRRRNVPTASPLFEVTTPRPRRRRHETGSPSRSSRAASGGASSGSTTNSRWVRPPARLSEPRARNRPRSQAARQWSRGRLPVERRGSALPVPEPPEAVGEAADGRLATGRCRAQAVDLGHAVAGTRRVDRRQLGAQRGDEVALGPAHVTARPAHARPTDSVAAPDAGLAARRRG